MKITPTIFDPKQVSAAQSTREGGVSTAPFDSLNLGLSVNDNKEHVIENRTRFFTSLGFSPEQISISKQVHGKHVLHVGKPGICEGYDAQITNVPGICLAVSVADCVPVLIHDPVTKAVAAIHAGWRGTVADISGETLRMMKEKFNTDPVNCVAFIGACIEFDNFEVGDEVAAQFSGDIKRKNPITKKYHVDLKKANLLLLEKWGIPRENIEISEHCTWRDGHLFFSHRRDKGTTGRMMAAIGLKII
ncbi:MAG: peptidoglycan editing factor PgeF [Flavobacteriales bacterium]